MAHRELQGDAGSSFGPARCQQGAAVQPGSAALMACRALFSMMYIRDLSEQPTWPAVGPRGLTGAGQGAFACQTCGIQCNRRRDLVRPRSLPVAVHVAVRSVKAAVNSAGDLGA